MVDCDWLGVPGTAGRPSPLSDSPGPTNTAESSTAAGLSQGSSCS